MTAAVLELSHSKRANERKINKRAFIQGMYDRGINAPAAIAAQGRKVGLRMSAHNVSNIVYRMKQQNILRLEANPAQTKQVDPPAKIQSQPVAKENKDKYFLGVPNNSKDTFSQLHEAADFVRKCGGVDQAIELLSVIKKLQFSQ